MTEWRPVVGYEGRYSVSDNGQVRNDVTGKVRKLRVRPDGYTEVDWKTNGKKEHFLVHPMVLRAFVGDPPEDKPWTLHRNGVRDDNRVENLYWGDSKENMQDRIRHGNNPMLNRTHFAQGHPFDETNTGWKKGGAGRRRYCKACETQRAKVRWAKKLAERPV